MVELYRRDAERDARLVQPLANACLRLAAFEWKTHKDAAVVLRLWAEAARALAGGWTAPRAGFDPSPDCLILALHLSIAARERESFTKLARLPAATRLALMRGSEAFRGARPLVDLAEGYALAACALVERDAGVARPACELLTSARRASERSWWRHQFADQLEAAWRFREHEATCALLRLVAEQIASRAPVEFDPAGERRGAEFVSLLDEALTELDGFTSRAEDHYPKLYVWLPGVALCRLAASAGLPLGELRGRSGDGYDRLPPDLL